MRLIRTWISGVLGFLTLTAVTTTAIAAPQPSGYVAPAPAPADPLPAKRPTEATGATKAPATMSAAEKQKNLEDIYAAAKLRSDQLWIEKREVDKIYNANRNLITVFTMHSAIMKSRREAVAAQAEADRAFGAAYHTETQLPLIPAKK